MDFSTIAQLGKRMLHITERLHKDYGLGHRAPGARTWMFRRRFTPDNTVLVGMHALRPLLMDPFGYHRIYELQQLVITLIYLGNPSVHQYALSKTSVADIDAIYPYDSSCVPPLRELLEYVLSFDLERGEFDQDMYSEMRRILGQMIRSATSGDAPPGPIFASCLSAERRLRSGSAQYIPSGDVIEDADLNVLGALVVPNGGQRRSAVLKCSADNELIEEEFEYSRAIEPAPWARKIIEKFTDAHRRESCIAYERVGLSLDSFVKSRGGLPAREVARVGLRMLDITEQLHADYALGHRVPGARSWMLPQDSFGLEEIFVVGTHALRPLSKDPVGNHRIYELKQLVVTLIYLGDPAARQYALSKSAPADITAIYPYERTCVPLLRELLEYVVSVPSEGEGVSRRMIPIMRRLLGEMRDWADQNESSSVPMFVSCERLQNSVDTLIRSVMRLQSGTMSRYIYIQSGRNEVLVTAYDKFRGLSPGIIRHGRIGISFDGERGIDAGGLKKEWYTLVGRDLFNPNYALFEETYPGSNKYKPNPASGVNPRHLEYFNFAGQFAAKAILDRQAIPAYFTKFFYNYILNGGQIATINLADYEEYSRDHYRQLMDLLNGETPDFILQDMTFTTDELAFGQHREVELGPGGSARGVTNSNKQEYVRLLIDYKLRRSVETQMRSFLDGFYSIIPLARLQAGRFNAASFRVVIAGIQDVDVADLRRHTRYRGYGRESRQIVWFWEILGTMSKTELTRLVSFVTGSSQVPIGGFAYIREGSSGNPGAFTIVRAGANRDAAGRYIDLPKAHTCFNELELPPYGSKAEMQGKLITAIYEGAGSFALG